MKHKKNSFFGEIPNFAAPWRSSGASGRRRGASMRIENLRKSYVYPRAVEIQRCIVSSYFFVIVSDVIINMDRSMNVDVYVHTYYAYIYILIEYVVYIYISIMR